MPKKCSNEYTISWESFKHNGVMEDSGQFDVRACDVKSAIDKGMDDLIGKRKKFFRVNARSKKGDERGGDWYPHDKTYPR